MVVAQSVEFKMRDAVFGKQPLKSVCNVIGVEVWNPAFYLFKYCFWKLNEPVTSIALRRFNDRKVTSGRAVGGFYYW